MSFMGYYVIFGPEDPIVVLEGPKVKQHLHFSYPAEDFVFWNSIGGIPHESALNSDTVGVSGSLFDVLKKS